MIFPSHALIDLHRHPYANKSQERVMPGPGEAGHILLSLYITH